MFRDAQKYCFDHEILTIVGLGSRAASVAWEARRDGVYNFNMVDFSAMLDPQSSNTYNVDDYVQDY